MKLQAGTVAVPLGAVWMALCVAASAGKAHEHGAVKLDIVVDAAEVTLAVEMPLDSLVGFERAPRTDVERKAAAAALTAMRDGGALFRFDAKAQCALHDASVEAPVLEQANRAVGRPAVSTEEHAELGATYVFRCAQPARLTTLEVLLFDAFRRVERIDVKTALPQGQSKTVLRRSARVVRLAK